MTENAKNPPDPPAKIDHKEGFCNFSITENGKGGE